MKDFLSGRLQQRKADREALIDQEALKAQRREQIKGMVLLMKDLLADARYAALTQLLSNAHTSLLAEREALLRTAHDGWEPDALILTGRIMQLDYILHTPDQFLALADEPEANGHAARSPARQPVGKPLR